MDKQQAGPSYIDRRRFLTLTAAFAGASLAGTALAQAGKSTADLDSLVKAAKAEGGVVLYSAAPDNASRRFADAFTAKYGIKVSFVRLASNKLLQRYAAEAEAGNFAADVLFNAGASVAFAEEGIKKGWIEPVAKAGIPVLDSGEYPAKFNRGVTAIIQLTPWLIVYNTEKVKGADVPKAWPDVLNPKFRGQLIIPDPKASDAYLDVWALILDAHGPQFFSQLRAQKPRIFDSSAVAVQSLGAGEGSLMFPTTVARGLDVKTKGGPVEAIAPDHTTGVEMQGMLTARTKAKHPNAARLLLHYVMSPDGNKVFNDEPGGVTVYDTSGLPKRYESPKPGTIARKGEILKLLGL